MLDKAMFVLKMLSSRNKDFIIIIIILIFIIHIAPV